MEKEFLESILIGKKRRNKSNPTFGVEIFKEFLESTFFLWEELSIIYE
jgi:hypothetical protein